VASRRQSDGFLLPPAHRSLPREGGKTMQVMDIPMIDQLSISEKILLVEYLWDSIVLDKSTI